MTELRAEGALFAVTAVLLVVAPVLAIGGGGGRRVITASCLLSTLSLLGWAALMVIELSRPNTGGIDCAVAPQNGERETLVLALLCSIPLAFVAIRSAYVARSARAAIVLTLSASAVVVSAFVYVAAANPVC